jgi:hypothetical protein
MGGLHCSNKMSVLSFSTVLPENADIVPLTGVESDAMQTSTHRFTARDVPPMRARFSFRVPNNLRDHRVDSVAANVAPLVLS